MKTETIKSERHGAIEHRVVRKAYIPYVIGRAIHKHTRIGRYPKVLNWYWMGQDERGIGWYGEYWGHRGNGGQMRRRVSMTTALKAMAESNADEIIKVEPELDERGWMTGNIIATEHLTLDWGALAGAFSI